MQMATDGNSRRAEPESTSWGGLPHAWQRWRTELRAGSNISSISNQSCLSNYYLHSATLTEERNHRSAVDGVSDPRISVHTQTHQSCTVIASEKTPSRAMRTQLPLTASESSEAQIELSVRRPATHRNRGARYSRHAWGVSAPMHARPAIQHMLMMEVPAACQPCLAPLHWLPSQVQIPMGSPMVLHAKCIGPAPSTTRVTCLWYKHMIMTAVRTIGTVRIQSSPIAVGRLLVRTCSGWACTTACTPARPGMDGCACMPKNRIRASSRRWHLHMLSHEQRHTRPCMRSCMAHHQTRLPGWWAAKRSCSAWQHHHG